MKVTVNILTDSQTCWGEPIACTDYEATAYDGFTQIQLLREIDGINYVIHEISVSHRHSYRLIVVED